MAVNDAVVTTFGGDLHIRRVIAHTQDGRRVIEWWGNLEPVKIEPEAGWPTVGRFERRQFLWCSGWVFVPQEAPQ